MSSYCFKCRKNTESKNLKVLKTKNGRIMLLSKCAVCNKKKLKFIKEQEASRLLSSLSIKAPLSKRCRYHLYRYSFALNVLRSYYKLYKWMKIWINFYEQEINLWNLRQPGFKYSTCEPLTKSKEIIQKFKETGDSQYFYQNELYKASFQLDLAYKNFKDLSRRITPNKILRDKAFNIAQNPNYDGYQPQLALPMAYKFTGSDIKNKIVEKLQKPMIGKFLKETYTHLLQTIFGVLILLICN